MRNFVTFCFWSLLTLAPTFAGACQCGAIASAGSTVRDVRSSRIRSLTDQDVVFEGVVERQVFRLTVSVPTQKTWENYRLVTVRATAFYRGPKREKLEIKTGLGGGDCGFDFQTGESYLIYAYLEKGGALLTSRCSGTNLTEYAGPDLRILRGDQPAAEDSFNPETYWKYLRDKYQSNVCGRVVRGDGAPAGGASIRLVREGLEDLLPPGYPAGDWSTVSKPDGSYCVEYVPRGRYLLSARQDIKEDDTRYVGELSRWWRPLPVRVESGKALSGLTIVLHRDLLYTARKHTLVGSILTAVLIVALIVIWRWRMRGQLTSPLP